MPELDVAESRPQKSVQGSLSSFKELRKERMKVTSASYVNGRVKNAAQIKFEVRQISAWGEQLGRRKHMKRTFIGTNQPRFSSQFRSRHHHAFSHTYCRRVYASLFPHRLPRFLCISQEEGTSLSSWASRLARHW